MSETQAHSNDDWLPDYSQKSADNPTREDLREALDNAPEAPRKVSDDTDAPKPKSEKLLAALAEIRKVHPDLQAAAERAGVAASAWKSLMTVRSRLWGSAVGTPITLMLMGS
jgi:hypothetical protein